MSAVERDPGREWRWPVAARTTTLVLVSFAGGLGVLFGLLEQAPAGPVRTVDLGVGALASLGLLARRRAPVVTAVLLALAAAVAATAGLANWLALYALARRRRLPVALAVAVLDIAAGAVFWLLYPANSTLGVTLLVNTALAAAFSGWGAWQQAQRALVASYRERAERVERTQSMREIEVRLAERSRIATEMHDAVAHRISLVALHAGGLAVAPAPSREEVRSSAGAIRSAAVTALQELREALGVLHTDEVASLQQPGLDRLDDLVREARDAGQLVSLTVTGEPRDGPAGVGRAAYRIVQEGITNARKHAPSARVSITVSRTCGRLRVSLSNPLVPDSLDVPGSGRGLIGLRERAALAGGTLSCGPTPGNEFVIDADLPWD